MHPSHPMQINLNYPTICNKTPLPLVVLSGGICVICNLGFVGVLLRICWICVFGFLSGVGRRTVCGENDGRIGVCITAKLDCIVFTAFHCVHCVPLCSLQCCALISYVCPCVHEQRRRSEYFSGEGWIEHWTSKTQDEDEDVEKEKDNTNAAEDHKKRNDLRKTQSPTCFL